MIQYLLPFVTAISLSVIAAYYSVIGLAKLFPGSFLPVVVMGTVLEVAKLVTVSWLYNNWAKAKFLMKVYFLIAIVLLMGITSMGIFGFLSRAHIETNSVLGENSVQLKTIEQREKIINDRLKFLLKKAGDDPEKISRRTAAQIDEVQKDLVNIQREKLPFLQEQNKLKAEVGPVQYIAEILYDKADSQFIDKAVRIVIFIIIIVFDPLAVLLLIASNLSFRRRDETEDGRFIKVKKTDIIEMG